MFYLIVKKPGDVGHMVSSVGDDTLYVDFAPLLDMDVRVPKDPHLWGHHHQPHLPVIKETPIPQNHLPTFTFMHGF